MQTSFAQRSALARPASALTTRGSKRSVPICAMKPSTTPSAADDAPLLAKKIGAVSLSLAVSISTAVPIASADEPSVPSLPNRSAMLEAYEKSVAKNNKSYGYAKKAPAPASTPAAAPKPVEKPAPASKPAPAPAPVFKKVEAPKVVVPPPAPKVVVPPPAPKVVIPPPAPKVTVPPPKVFTPAPKAVAPAPAPVVKPKPAPEAPMMPPLSSYLQTPPKPAAAVKKEAPKPAAKPAAAKPAATKSRKRTGPLPGWLAEFGVLGMIGGAGFAALKKGDEVQKIYSAVDKALLGVKLPKKE